jgi:hypothetical protein
MALSVVNARSSRECAPIDWAAVQLAQFEHDEKYHREISRLSVQDRLRHMALHFAKYAGRLQGDLTDPQFQRIATDSLIIAISSANTLNIDLGAKAFGGEHSNAPRDTFAKRLTVAAGRMAGACERLDHLEDFPFRPAITDEVLAILGACLDLFEAEGWSPAKEMEERLAPVKAKWIFHGKL